MELRGVWWVVSPQDHILKCTRLPSAKLPLTDSKYYILSPFHHFKNNSFFCLIFIYLSFWTTQEVGSSHFSPTASQDLELHFQSCFLHWSHLFIPGTKAILVIYLVYLIHTSQYPRAHVVFNLLLNYSISFPMVGTIRRRYGIKKQGFFLPQEYI